MKFLKWLNVWRNAEVHHHMAEKLSNNKLFQKIVIGTYHAPIALKKKIDSLDFSEDGNKKKEEEQKTTKLLGGSCKNESNREN